MRIHLKNPSKALLLGGLLFVAPLLIGEESPDPDLFEKERQIKNEEEAKLQKDILDPILGQGKAVVFVDVELGIETQRLQQQGAAEEKKSKANPNAGPKDTEFILPGLPRPKSVTQKEEKPANSRDEEQTQKISKEKIVSKTVIRKFGVTVVHDERILPPQIAVVKERILAAMAKYKLKENQLVFKPTKFTTLTWDQLLKPELLVWFVMAFLALLFLLFLFGPLRAFFKSYLSTIQDKPDAEVNVESKIEGEDGDEDSKDLAADVEGGGGGAGQYWDDHPDYRPFAYVNEENIVKLAYLVRKEPPDIISVVVNYLQPDYVRAILRKLSPEVQAKVAVYMATIRQMSFEQVLAVDKNIKARIDFLVGSLDSLLKLLDVVDKQTQENILEYLKNEKPALYQKVMDALLTFDDIPKFDNQTLQLVIRELRPDSLAKALRSTPPEILTRFFDNMTSGATSLLKEEMEYGRPLTEDEVEQERDKIVDVVKRMQLQNKIAVRKQRATDILDGEEETPSSALRVSLSSTSAQVQAEHPVDPQLPQYFASAVELFNQGRVEEAMPYFQYVTQIEPAHWQAHQYLGGCYNSLGLVNEALASYEQVLAYHPSEELAAWVESVRSSLQSSPTQGEAA